MGHIVTALPRPLERSSHLSKAVPVDDLNKEDLLSAVESQEAENKKLSGVQSAALRDNPNSAQADEASEAYAAGVERMQALMAECRRRGYL